MALKSNKETKVETEEKEGKLISILIGMVLFILFLGFVSFLIKIDVGGFGSKVLRPILKDVPVINRILPAAEDGDLAFEKNYEYDNLADAMKRVRELENQIKELTKTNKDTETKNLELEEEVKRLQIFEQNLDEFEKRVEEFDQNVVFSDRAPSIEEYKAYYESIEAEHAAEIYRQVINQWMLDEKMKEQSDRYAKMDPKAAATALQEMSGDLDLVATILSGMKTKESAAIMDEMTPNFCAKVTKKLSVME